MKNKGLSVEVGAGYSGAVAEVSGFIFIKVIKI